jgi:MraZ protein
MFVGRFEHSLDAKGRLVLPASFREQLQLGGYVTKALDGGLSIWTPNEFEQEANEMVERAKRGDVERSALRSFSSGASPIQPDRQGRIAIPQNLRDYAGLDREVIVIGAITSIEIWDAARWAEIDRQGEAILAGSPSSTER